MGAGASTGFKSEEAALAGGKTQVEINAYLAAQPTNKLAPNPNHIGDGRVSTVELSAEYIAADVATRTYVVFKFKNKGQKDSFLALDKDGWAFATESRSKAQCFTQGPHNKNRAHKIFVCVNGPYSFYWLSADVEKGVGAFQWHGLEDAADFVVDTGKGSITCKVSLKLNLCCSNSPPPLHVLPSFSHISCTDGLYLSINVEQQHSPLSRLATRSEPETRPKFGATRTVAQTLHTKATNGAKSRWSKNRSNRKRIL